MSELTGQQGLRWLTMALLLAEGHQEFQKQQQQLLQPAAVDAVGVNFPSLAIMIAIFAAVMPAALDQMLN